MNSRIRALPPREVALIAAGEVVERPASAVKELIENALDAGAASIAVTLQAGGLREILVVDDGEGVLPGDFSSLCAPHATSKIGRLADLAEVATLGFRGEALHALSQVGDVIVRSRTAEGAGHEGRFGEGVLHNSRPAGIPPGTQVAVRDLFHRLPARKRFLGREAAEAARCRRVVLEFCLAHPEVAFSLDADGKRLLRTSGKHDPRDLLLLAWGAEAAVGALAVDAAGPGWSVEGFLARPDHAVRQGGLSASVNGRPVAVPSLAAALRRATAPWMGAGLLPRAVLRFRVDPARLDCNVHPAKARVAVDAAGWETAVVDAARMSLTAALGSPALPVGLSPGRLLGLDRPVAYLGMVFQTMLVYTQGEDLVLLDGHAASERVVYERLLAARPTPQPLAMPLEMPLPSEADARRALWERLGLEWDEDPDTWTVTGAPTDLPGGSLGVLLAEEDGEAPDPQHLLERLRTGACRRAWRAGDPLAPAAALDLWRTWAACRDPWTCPHGRRAAVRLSRADAERLFQRSGPG